MNDEDEDMLARMEISPAVWKSLPEQIQMEMRALYEQSGKTRLMVKALRNLIEWIETGTDESRDEALAAAQAAMEEGRAD